MNNLICTECGEENKTNAKYCSSCGHELPKPKFETIETPIQQGKTTKLDSRKKKIGSIVGIIAFAVSFWAVQQVFFKPPSFDKAIMQAASELNKTCPIMIDQYTRLDNAIAMPNNALQYNYTLVNLEKAEVVLDTVKKYLNPTIIKNVKTNPDLKAYRDNQTTMIYYYRDKNGEFVYKLIVTPEMYQ